MGYRRIFAINTIGFLAINVILLRPVSVRPYLLLEREGVAFGRGMAAIVMERLLDLSMLLVFLLGLGVVVDLPASGIQIPVGDGAVDVVQAGQRAVAAVVALGGLEVARSGGGGRADAGPARSASPGASWRASPASSGKDSSTSPGARFAPWASSPCPWSSDRDHRSGGPACPLAGLPVGVGPAWATWTITISGMTAVPTAGSGAYELFCSAALGLWGVLPESLAATFGIAPPDPVRVHRRGGGSSGP